MIELKLILKSIKYFLIQKDLEILEKLPDFSHKQEYLNLLVKNR